MLEFILKYSDTIYVQFLFSEVLNNLSGFNLDEKCICDKATVDKQQKNVISNEAFEIKNYFRKIQIENQINLTKLNFLNKYLTYELEFCQSNLYFFPTEFCKFQFLERLTLKDLNLDDFPDEFENLINLNSLDIKTCHFVEIPKVVFQLKNLQLISFCSMPKNFGSLLTCNDLKKEYDNNWIRYQKFFLNFDKFTKIVKSYQDEEIESEFVNEMLDYLPNLVSVTFPDSILKKRICQTLACLDLSYRSFEIIDDSIVYLQNLRILNLKNNYKLKSISSKICYLPLAEINIEECPSLRTPPLQIISNGLPSLKHFMERLEEGSVECKRTKLMLVGLGGSGKTTLVNTLLDESKESPTPTLTDGIVIKKWKRN